MADDNIKNTVADVETAKKATSELDTEANTLLKSLSRLSKGFTNFVRSTAKGSGSVAKNIKTMTEEMTELEKAFGSTLKIQDKALLSTYVNLSQYSRQTAKATSELDKVNDRIDENIIKQKKQAMAIAKTKDEIAKLEEKQKKYNILSAQEASLLKKKKHDLEETQSLYESTTNELNDLVDAETRYKQAVIENKKNTLSELEVLRMRNHEFDIMEGGSKAVTAQFKKMGEQRLFKIATEISTGAAALALFTTAAYKANKALAETADYMKTTRGVAVSLGQDIKGGVWSAFKGATEASVNLMEISSDLGIKLEEVSEAANKVRLGIRMDKEGALSERAIAGLTAEAARFAKIADMDTAGAVDLLDKRIKQFGMTAGQAEADMRNMRVTLGQMAAGSKNNAISIGEMVSILEEASAASQSYVVDTRMMTQALRGAVTQAEMLGASQKEAKDIAKATGKVFGSAPDWVRIPAGHNLMNQLLGADSDKFLARFNSATQKRLLSLRNAVRAGEVGNEAAAQELMDLIGSSDAGMEAQFDQMKNVLFVNGKRATNAALVIKEQFQLENMAVAGMLTRMMQDAAELQEDVAKDAMKKGMSEKAAKEFARKAVPFSTAMAKQTASFNQSIHDALKNGTNAVSALTKQGMTEEAAKEYFDFYKKNADKEKQYQNDVQAVIDDRLLDEGTKQRKLFELKKKHNEEIVRHQMDLAKKGTDPIGALMDRLKVDGETVSIDVSQLKEAGYKNAEDFAKAMGIAGKDQISELKDLYENDGKIQGEKLREMRTLGQEEAKKQEAYLTSFANKLSEGLLPALGYFARSILATFGIGGPVADIMMSVAAAIGGLVALFKGPKLIEALIQRAVTKGVIEAKGIGPAGLLPPPSDGSSSSPPALPEDPKASKKAERKAARGRAKAAAAEGLRTIRSGRGVRGRMAGFKNLMESSKELSQGLGLTGRLAKGIPALGSLISVGMGAKNIMDDRAAIDERTDLSDREKGDLKTKSTGREVGGMVGTVALGALGTMIGGPIGGVIGATVGDYLGKATGEMIGGVVNKLSTPDEPKVAPMAIPPTGAITGATTAMTVPTAPLGSTLSTAASGMPGNPGANQLAMAMASTGPGAQGLKELIARPKVGGVNPDGSVLLKIENFIDLFSNVQQMVSRTNLRAMKTT